MGLVGSHLCPDLEAPSVRGWSSWTPCTEEPWLDRGLCWWGAFSCHWERRAWTPWCSHRTAEDAVNLQSWEWCIGLAWTWRSFGGRMRPLAQFWNTNSLSHASWPSLAQVTVATVIVAAWTQTASPSNRRTNRRPPGSGWSWARNLRSSD